MTGDALLSRYGLRPARPSSADRERQVGQIYLGDQEQSGSNLIGVDRLYPFQRWAERQQKSLTYYARGFKFGHGFSTESAYVVRL